MSDTTMTGVSAIEQEREAYRQKERRRSVFTSIASSIALAAALFVVLKLSPGWPRVKESFFSPEYFVLAWPQVVEGLLLNIRVLGVALIGVAILGTSLALIRMTTSAVMFPLRVLARFYTTIMRGIPMLVVLYLIGFGIPGLGLFGRIDKAVLGTIAVVMSYSAYIAEVLRAGFEDVHPSQRASARSLGLTTVQTMWYVIIPQGLRKVAPALMNDFIAMQKDVGLISTLGAVDAVRAAQIVVAKTYNFTPYVVASILFILMSVPFIILNDWYSERLRKREQTGGMV
ncbi:MAG: amino acid ABC transporter permease [Coriobacteriales bacterium]|nr:amino acid ABC transporter permease [Coriobacteriales bacterium]MDO5709003.1 amino acid ABC transporter permease [Coriobacteriales bacterium]